MDDGILRVRVRNIQSCFHIHAWVCLHFAALSLPPILGTMERDPVGHLPSCNQMEARTHWHSPIDCKYIVDNPVHHHVEIVVTLSLRRFGNFVLNQRDKAFARLSIWRLSWTSLNGNCWPKCRDVWKLIC